MNYDIVVVIQVLTTLSVISSCKSLIDSLGIQATVYLVDYLDHLVDYLVIHLVDRQTIFTARLQDNLIAQLVDYR